MQATLFDIAPAAPAAPDYSHKKKYSRRDIRQLVFDAGTNGERPHEEHNSYIWIIEADYQALRASIRRLYKRARIYNDETGVAFNAAGAR